ncbi:MAG: hypothetical protein ICV64_06060 [Thermoleophilia bacterium]|nr:hypothetical protein [Thermoleophilia bacterium]
MLVLRSFSILLLTLLAAAVVATPAAPAPGMVVGAADSAAKWGGLVGATTQMQLARLAGLDAIRLTSPWRPGQRRPSEQELGFLRDAAGGAQLAGMRVFVAVYTPRNRWTPTTAQRRRDFAAYTAELARTVPGVTDVIVGNEPNLNRFWMPQFDRRGRTVSAAAYGRLLAQTYDAVKEAAPDVVVVGGAVSPRGSDSHRSSRHTHSPTRFIRELGRAYRLSRRDRPLMDAFAIHPYPTTGRSPARPHPRSTTIGIADYRKLVRLLGTSFNGTAQRGSTLPIVYTEFGVQTKIPKRKRHLYRHLRARAARQAVSERVQARHYRQALAMAQCQPTVVGLLFFHVTDDRDARAWQSGLFYADRTPKSSFAAVRAAAELAREGRFARCGRPKAVNPLERVAFREDEALVELVCSRACRYVVKLVPLPGVSPHGAPPVARTVGEAEADVEHAIELVADEAPPGRYRYLVRVADADSPGAAVVRYGPEVTVAPPPDPPPPDPPPPPPADGG